jgi:hypothetical protein
MGGSVLENW